MAGGSPTSLMTTRARMRRVNISCITSATPRVMRPLMAEDLAALLAPIRADLSIASRTNPSYITKRAVRLLAAVEAALKLADDLDAEAARLLATAARLKTGAAVGTQNRAWAHRDCAKALREA